MNASDYSACSATGTELIMERTGAHWLYWLALFAIAALVSAVTASPAAIFIAVAVLAFGILGGATA